MKSFNIIRHIFESHDFSKHTFMTIIPYFPPISSWLIFFYRYDKEEYDKNSKDILKLVDNLDEVKENYNMKIIRTLWFGRCLTLESK